MPSSTRHARTPRRSWTSSAPSRDRSPRGSRARSAHMKVGFAGLGAMGRGMARNLHRAGLLTAVWNRTPHVARELATELGVSTPATLAALASECSCIVTCVSADADVLAVVDGLAPTLARGGLIIDCSTVSGDTAREAAQRLATRQVEF